MRWPFTSHVTLDLPHDSWASTMPFWILIWPLSFYMTVELSSDFSHFMWDPWASTHFTFSYFFGNYIITFHKWCDITHWHMWLCNGTLRRNDLTRVTLDFIISMPSSSLYFYDFNLFMMDFFLFFIFTLQRVYMSCWNPPSQHELPCIFLGPRFL